MSTQALAEHGTYRFHLYDGTAFFTCYGSDAATYRKGWRSLGCFFCEDDEADANIAALERQGYTLETRSAIAMSAFDREGARANAMRAKP